MSKKNEAVFISQGGAKLKVRKNKFWESVRVLGVSIGVTGFVMALGAGLLAGDDKDETAGEAEVVPEDPIWACRLILLVFLLMAGIGFFLPPGFGAAGAGFIVAASGYFSVKNRAYEQRGHKVPPDWVDNPLALTGIGGALGLGAALSALTGAIGFSWLQALLKSLVLLD